MTVTKKVMIAEDDKFLSNAYKVKLTKEGFDICMAADGIEVFEKLEDFRPDVILLDLIMPRKDGFTVLEELKKNPNYRDIPVVIASNLGQKEDLDRGLALGAKDYVIKSEMSLEDLVKKIKSA